MSCLSLCRVLAALSLLSVVVGQNVVVRTMPGFPNVPHTQPEERHLARPGQQVILWGNADLAVPAGYSYTWSLSANPDVAITDHSPRTAPVTDARFLSAVVSFQLLNGVTRTVVSATLAVDNGSGSSGSRFVEIEIVDPTDPSSSTPLQAQAIDVNIAIAGGLRWLYLHQDMAAGAGDGRWLGTVGGGYAGYHCAATGFALWAMQNQGHFATNDPAEDILAEPVRRGFGFLFRTAVVRNDVAAPRADLMRGARVAGESDLNGNGRVIDLCPDIRTGYGTPIACAAIIASAQPTRVVDEPGPLFGMTYREVVEDTVDRLGVMQGFTGGWYYDQRNTISDMSINSWAYVALEGAEAVFAVDVPDWIKQECEISLITHQNGPTGGTGPRLWGYRSTAPAAPDHGAFATTGAGLAGLVLVESEGPHVSPGAFILQAGDTIAAKRAGGLAYLGTNWGLDGGGGWSAGNRRNTYAMWTVARALRMTAISLGLPPGENLQLVNAGVDFDWATGEEGRSGSVAASATAREGYYSYLIRTQENQSSLALVERGRWNLGTNFEDQLETSLSVLILTPRVFTGSCPGNLPPTLLSGPANNQVRTHVGAHAMFTLTFGPPEPGQTIARIDVDSLGLANFTFDPPTLGLTGRVTCHFHPTIAQVTMPGGPHRVRITAHDDCGTPLSLPVDIDIEVCICPADAAVTEVGPGWPGTLGMPTLSATLPTACSRLTLTHGSSLDTDAAGCLWIGTEGIDRPAPFGGRQYIDPDSGVRGIHAYVLPVAGTSVTLPVPCTSAILCGQVVFAQAFQLDPGAAGGMSLTRGLRLTVGN